MRILGYKMTHDTGFAPNPFHGYMTLATCKPTIRRTRSTGDWIAGFSSSALVNAAKKGGVEIKPMSLIYLMKITEDPLSFDEYFQDSRFKKKRPTPRSSNPTISCGDNIYYTNIVGEVIQISNKHHNNIKNQEHDIGGKNVLISKMFYYFGRNCIYPDLGWSHLIGSELSSGRTFFVPIIFSKKFCPISRRTIFDQACSVYLVYGVIRYLQHAHKLDPSTYCLVPMHPKAIRTDLANQLLQIFSGIRLFSNLSKIRFALASVFNSSNALSQGRRRHHPD